MRHLFALGIGGIAAFAVYHIPMQWWEKSGVWLFFLGILLLVLVLIPGIGRSANGATRWIPLGGFNLQSSEFMKFVAVIYVSDYLTRRQVEVSHSFWGMIKPMMLLFVACFLIMLQPDFGTTAVLFATIMGLLFLGGVSLKHFGTLFFLGMAAAIALVVTASYRLKRVTSFMDPWKDVNDSGYQLAQALIAFGRGEWTGVGLGNGIQKMFYLPEAHTDFLMAVIGEEFGLLGSVGIIAIFAVIVWRAFNIGVRAEAIGWRFGAYCSYGFALWMAMQASINIGVNVGLLPTKGLTLPMMSYGGNAIIVTCIIVAFLFRVDTETKRRSEEQNGKVAA
jgi:cell division protein FtsW